jgi:hypothetical protein
MGTFSDNLLSGKVAEEEEITQYNQTKKVYRTLDAQPVIFYLSFKNVHNYR